MCSRDQVQSIRPIELLRYVRSKCVACSSWRHAPAHPFIGVRPKQVAHGPFMGDFLNSVKFSNLIEAFEMRREASMETENLILNNSCHRQVVKKVSVVFPNICIAVFPITLVIKSIDLCNLSALMIASQNGNSVRESHFEQYKNCYTFKGVIASVHVVSHKEIIGVWRKSSNSKQLKQVMELAMHVSAYCDGGSYWGNIGLFRKDLFGLALKSLLIRTVFLCRSQATLSIHITF